MPRLPSQLTYNDLNGREASEILVDWFRQLLASHPLLQPHLTLPMADIHLSVDIGIDMYIGGAIPIDSPPEHESIVGSVSLGNKTVAAATAATSGAVVERSRERLSTRINGAPIEGGTPPDQIRESHGLPVSRPGYGPRDTGSHLFLADIVDEQVAKSASAAPVAPPDPRTGGRVGTVAEGYVFSSEPGNVSPQQQVIPVGRRGKIDIDLSGEGKMHQGALVVTAEPHAASVKELGDGKGQDYGSVTSTYDAGPAGLARHSGGGGGLYSDGRSRLSFGNNHRG